MSIRPCLIPGPGLQLKTVSVWVQIPRQPLPTCVAMLCNLSVSQVLVENRANTHASFIPEKIAQFSTYTTHKQVLSRMLLLQHTILISVVLKHVVELVGVNFVYVLLCTFSYYFYCVDFLFFLSLCLCLSDCLSLSLPPLCV